MDLCQNMPPLTVMASASMSLKDRSVLSVLTVFPALHLLQNAGGCLFNQTPFGFCSRVPEEQGSSADKGIRMKEGGVDIRAAQQGMGIVGVNEIILPVGRKGKERLTADRLPLSIDGLKEEILRFLETLEPDS